MLEVKTVVYNQANLLSWQQELLGHQNQISEKARFIEEQERLLNPLQQQLESKNSTISILERQLKYENLRSDQDMIHHMHDHHHHGHHHHHHHRDWVLHYMGDFAREWNRQQIQNELGRLQRERILLQHQMKPYQQAISSANAELEQLRSRERFLNRHIIASDYFLRTLQNNPLELVTNLAEKLKTTFARYEDAQHTALSPQTRISLIAARYGLNELTRCDNSYNPEFMHRSNYLRVCGFIADMYARVRQENSNPTFEKALGELVEDTHVLCNEDLPESFQTGYSAQQWFEVSKNANPNYFAIQPAQLPAIEEQIFKNGLANIKQSNVAELTYLQRHIINAAHLIDAEVETKKQQYELIDYHFYERTVRTLGEVLANPTDIQAAKRLGNIAEHVSGNPSVGKQVLGGLLVALGVVLISASVAGFVASFGSSSALSAVGMALGLSLLHTQIVLGVTSSVAAATGIGLTFFAGPNTFKSGQRQGLSQELIDVKEGVEHYHAQP